MNPIVQKFINDLTEALKDENDSLKYSNQDEELIDIPYLIAPISQHLHKYTEFINEISTHNYCINGYDKDNTGGYTNGRIRILIEKEHTDDSCMEFERYGDYCYYIEFEYDDRYWGYCQCTSDMTDYRDDKGCCGHGCDFVAPAFRVTKEYNLGYDSWSGDEHDLWKFEDNFYKSETELAEDKHRREIELEIARLEELISSSKKRLDELLNNK